MTNKEALDEYKNVYMAYRNFADRTRIEYQNDIESFIEFLEKAGIQHVKRMSLPIVERYVAYLEQNGFASLTRKRKVVSIRSFLLCLYQDGYIDTNISKQIVLPFAESTTPNILTETECHRLLEACAHSPRDRAIIDLLLQTGIKLSELTQLTIDDVEFKQINENINGYIRVLGGSGKKDRLIPLNASAYYSLKDYLGARIGAANKTLFLNRFGEPLGKRGVQKILKSYINRAGIGKASIHTLRHTFCAQHIAKGTSLKTIQDVLGHKASRSTMIYRSLAKEIVRREMQENSL